MLCEFERLIHPQKVSALETGSYMVALYRPCETIRDAAGNTMEQVKAVGYCLPIADNLRYNIKGHWTKDPKYGLQFEVDTFEEVAPSTRDGIVAYLSSGQIFGIGPTLAERIYGMFGDKSLEVLDQDPQKLLSVPGVGTKRLEKISSSYIANRGARDVVAFLLPYGITAKRAVQLYKEYGNRTMDTVKNHPYKLSEMEGIGFRTADKIAMSMGVDRLSPERVDEGLLYTLVEAEEEGHLCMEKHEFIEECLKILETPQLTEEMAANRAARLVHDGRLVTYKGYVFRAQTAQVEEELAESILRLQRKYKTAGYTELEKEIDREEKQMKIKMAAEQKDAVKMALSEGFSVITGGPGTGKTLILRIILNIYRRKHPEKKICCCAPTGRAARRMHETTEFLAATIHKVLGLAAGKNGNDNEPEMLDADLVLVDEVSMLDAYLAGDLFKALKQGTQMVFIGDVEQLPSVGPGAVLREIIASGCVPVVKLDTVFRQKTGSRIAVNAKHIRHGNVKLEYGGDFQFVHSPLISESARKIIDLYLEEVARYGIDNVALLTPYRKKTETSVNALNERLREMVNPPAPDKPEVVTKKRRFRLGDKVMQIKNQGDINNGDIGYISVIAADDDGMTVSVDFGDGRIKEYDLEDLDALDLGYASTIHKSQGSEYSSVIINLQWAHYIMLTRQLVYTAITRGKEKVTIVGEKRALAVAIRRTDIEKRGTCLAIRLQEAA